MPPNQLVEIQRCDWPKLRDLYIGHLNRSSSYSMLQNYINWLDQDSSIDYIKIYSLNGNWESDGTFVLKCENQICLNTLSDCQDRLVAALDCLDMKPAYVYAGCVERVLPSVVKHLANNKVCNLDDINYPGVWYHISKEDAEKFTVDPPEGITLSPLEETHMDTVNSVWPHRHPGSEEFVRKLILYNISVGAFDQNGTLIAWCLRLPLGSLGLLQVSEQHKRKGLGQLMVKSMAKKLVALGCEVMAPVVEANVASRNMFEKLGFKAIDRVYWLAKPAIHEK